MQNSPFKNNIYYWIIITYALMCLSLYVTAGKGGANCNYFIYL